MILPIQEEFTFNEWRLTTNDIITTIGDTDSLQTVEKASIVGALNELDDAVKGRYGIQYETDFDAQHPLSIRRINSEVGAPNTNWGATILQQTGHGTIEVPTAPTEGMALGGIEVQGFSGTQWGTTAKIIATAAANWSPTSHPSGWKIWTTDINSIIPVPSIECFPSGRVGLNGAVDNGVDELQVLGTIKASSIEGTPIGSVTPAAVTATTFTGSGSGLTSIPNGALVNSQVTIGATVVALGATVTTFTGLTSVTSTAFVGALTGNASTATTLQTPRTINGVSFNGSANITVPVNSVDDVATATSVYPLWTTAAGNVAAKVSTSKLSFVPSTGILTATGFAGSGAALTSIPNGALVNSQVTIGATVVALGATVTTFTGLTSVTSTTFVGALTGNAATATLAASATALQVTRTINGVNFNGTANITVPVNTTDDVATATSVYPTFVPTSAAANQNIKTSSTKLSFVPSTGILTATGFAGSGAGLTALNVDNATSGILAVARGGTGTTSTTGTGSVVYSASPALTGIPTAPTANVADNSTQIASTAFVKAVLTAGYATGATYAGDVTIAPVAASSILNLDKPTGVYSAAIKFKQASVLKFTLGYSYIGDAGEVNFSLLNSVPVTPVNAFTVFGATSNVAIGGITDNGYKLDVTGSARISSDLTVDGNLTVNGTVTTINSTVIAVDDINIELGSVATPSDATADGGGITLLGTTNKTISWSAANGWTSSETFNLVSGKGYRIAGAAVLTATTLGSGVTNSSLQTLGTIATGTWQATIIGPTYGGTGVNNGSKTITLGGNLTTSGAFATTLTVTGATNVTLPTTGTLASLAGTETLTNKTLSTGSVWNGGVISGTYGGTGVNNGTKTITLGGNLTTSGANNVTFTTSGATNVTLPTSGTLATTTGTVALATSVAGGTQWGILYQSAVSTTACTSAGAAGQVLISNATLAPSWVNGTISGVALGSNLNALTIGTGLGGVSYNGSTPITISVNYGTSSTTACRGDDSRLSNTRNTTNSITFNNSGAGAASPTTFDGSVARTISYNTIGASPLSGSTAIVTVGTISTGLWRASPIEDGYIASALTGKTYNGLTLVSATTGFTIAGGTTSKTLTINNTLGLSGTDGSTLNIGTGGTLGTGAFQPTATAASVGLGNVTNESKATMFTNPTFTGTSITVGNSTNSTIVMSDTDEGNRQIHCNINYIGFLTQAGGWGSYCDDSGNWTSVGNITAYSDETLKTDWEDLGPNFIEDLAKVKHGTYVRIDNPESGRQVGVGAQSLMKVMKEAVMKNNDGILSVAYGNAALTACVELAKEVVELRKEIEALKAK